MTRGIILSGGWGTRLRPLTCTIPKTLMPIVNKPVIERQMMLLKSAGVNEIILAVSVMSNDLKKYFKDGKKFGLKISYTDEKQPMGTAGAIKIAEDYLKGDNFFMLNGDVILNFSFKEMLQKHVKYQGKGTIAGKLVEDPSMYGVLIIDEETQKIKKFLEKDEYLPPGGKTVPMPINAGVYLLEPEVFDYIEPKKKVSIERDVFPKLASDNKLYHYPISGTWMDIGKPEDLLEGNIILMKDLLKNTNNGKKNLIDDSLDIEGRAMIYPPVTIGKNVVIRKNCEIGPNVIIGDNVYMGENSKVKESLVYNEVYISNNVHLENVIISDNCQIRDNVVLRGLNDSLVILASFVEVLKDIKLIALEKRNITVCHHEVVKRSIQ